MPDIRLDVALVNMGLAPSRTQAHNLIKQGVVMVNKTPVTKPSRSITDTDVIEREGPTPYASRGAGKLQPVLAQAGIDPDGKVCLDAGASTGGFTDVLLRAGALRVVAVDIGQAQLRAEMADDDRVTVHDHTNVRFISDGDIGGKVDLTVADLSFISLTKVLEALASCTHLHGSLLPMIKPQFEVGKERIGASGVVTDPDLRYAAVMDVVEAGKAVGWNTQWVAASPLPGPSGNVEFFAHMKYGQPDLEPEAIRAIVDAA
ncbi:TlyA family RNA methyltransferase [Haloglycomyces albus]|uniref:TlyA family RNA methyltransferase n=1 Tax=Haloglycomyces albus TaxID=526067 RepID=UPI00046D56F8|nr:TlyA family RNA methyltransferase [Haloglycomyces albus]